ncbi:MAG: preprotein translocase subunit SecY [Spirochaetes bacterium]|nr:preprotein translocase subunit SecY [Spirochaetota bacterium]
MLELIRNIFRIPELRQRILFTLGCLVVFRIGAHITCPGISPTGLAEMIKSLNQGNFGGLISFIDLFAGGAFERFTLFALGIMPYISASIIIQILTTVVPHLEQLQKEGEAGRRQLQQYMRYGTILICAVQAVAISRWIYSHPGVVAGDLQGHPAFFSFIVVSTITAGTVFLMWLGEQITERGIGNGVSLIIYAGIAARIPQEFMKVIDSVQKGDFNPVAFLLILFIFAVVVFFVVFEQEGQRRIPVQFARKVVGRKVYGSQNTYIPFKVNPTGVIPIIFASAMVMVPAQIAQMLGDKFQSVAQLATYLSPGQWPYVFVYGLLVIGFAYFYTFVVFNPVEIAENLKRSGGYIPGIRPGLHTQEYMHAVLTRITVAGSIFLAIVAVFPDLLLKIPMFTGITPGFAHLMGGTSLLILISVDLDTMKQIESQLVMREYDGFLSRRRKKRVR